MGSRRRRWGRARRQAQRGQQPSSTHLSTTTPQQHTPQHHRVAKVGLAADLLGVHAHQALRRGRGGGVRWGMMVGYRRKQAR